MWREGAGVPIPVTFPPIETIAICFLDDFFVFLSTKKYQIEKTIPRRKKSTSPLVLFLCCLFSDEDEGEGEDQEENDDGHDDEDGYDDEEEEEDDDAD